jgi:hypothetical protein
MRIENHIICHFRKHMWDVPGKKIDFSKKFQIAPKILGSCWA